MNRAKKIINTSLGLICAGGVAAGAIGPCWVAIIGLITATAAAICLLELNGNNVTTY